MFQALKPHYERTGETSYGPDAKPIHWYGVTWKPQGLVADLTEARAQYGRNIALEWVGKVH